MSVPAHLARHRLVLERLEERLAPAVRLTYGGLGTALNLAELTATPSVAIREQSATQLRIDLNGATFDPGSTTAATGLTYQVAGAPGASTFALIDISAANNITTLTTGLNSDALAVSSINNQNGGLGGLGLSAGSIILSGTINTTGGQTYNNAVFLGAATSLSSTVNGTVDFLATVDSTAGAPQSLTVATTGTGGTETRFDGPVVGGTFPLASLQVSGPTRLSSGVSTTGGQTYLGAVALIATATLVSTGGTIKFGDTLSAPFVSLTVLGNAEFDGNVSGMNILGVSGTALISCGLVSSSGDQTYSGPVTLNVSTTLTSTAGTVKFGAAVTDNSRAGGISLTVSGNATFLGIVDRLASLSVSGAAALDGGSVGTTGDQTYSGPVILNTPGGNTVLNGLNVTFAASLRGQTDGSQSLAVNANAKTIFGGPVGDNGQRLANLTTDAPGETDIDGGSVITTGDQTYNDVVIIGGTGATLTGALVTFGGTVNGQPVIITVTFATTVALTASPQPSAQGQPVAFTAVVISPVFAPVGTVTFFDGAAPLGALTLVSGRATLLVTGLAVGDHTITAAFNRNGSFLGSTSAPLVQTVTAGPVTTRRPSTIGMFDNTGFNPFGIAWYLRSSNGPGFPDAGAFVYGAVGWHAIVGDWNGDGTETIGVVNPFNLSGSSAWALRNENSPGDPDAGLFLYGLPTWTPLAGDWSGAGHAGIGMYDPATATWYLRNDAGPGLPNAIIQFGVPGWLPIVGDWDGGGRTELGVFDPTSATFYLASAAAPGGVIAFQFGVPGWKPVAGDFDGDGITTIGVVDPFGTWYLRNSNSSGGVDIGPFPYGLPFWTPVSGRYPFGAAEFAAGGPAVQTERTALANGQLQTIVTAALARVQASGADPALMGRLASAQFTVGQLTVGLLGWTDLAHNQVTLDASAAGYGWFVDPTPAQDEEFSGGMALAGSAAVGREDLLTVVLHEMAHLAGLPDRAGGPNDLMDATLAPGVRRTQALDAIFAKE
jgi:hypothetical protein